LRLRPYMRIGLIYKLIDRAGIIRAKVPEKEFDNEFVAEALCTQMVY